MQLNWESKFQNVGLTAEDCPHLLKDIEEAEDDWVRASLIYMYGYSCLPNLKIVSICDRYIVSPIPGVTAVCMRVLIDYWGMWQNYVNELEKYLNLDIFDKWYDEVIFAVGYVSRRGDGMLPKTLLSKLTDINNDPRAKKLGLLD
jgi:hypothetical protein